MVCARRVFAVVASHAHSVNHRACCSSTRGSQDAFQAAQRDCSSAWVKLVSEKSKVSRRNHCRSDPVQVRPTERHRACWLRCVVLSQLGCVLGQCGRYGLARCRVRVLFAASACGCYPGVCAAPSGVQGEGTTRRHLSKLKATLPRSNIYMTSKSPVGEISVVTMIKTNTTLDHGQKAEKVWIVLLTRCACAHCCVQVACLRFAFGGVAFAQLRAPLRQLYVRNVALHCWAEAPVQIARITLTIKLDRDWSSSQLASSALPLSVTDSAIAPSARMIVLGSMKRRWESVWIDVVSQFGLRRRDEVRPFCVVAPSQVSSSTLGRRRPAKILEVTLMRPIHGNL